VLPQAEMPQAELLQVELPQAVVSQTEMPQAVLSQGELTLTLTAKLSTEKLTIFPSMLPDDLLGQANLLSLYDGMYIGATFVPMSIQHNLDFQGCSERS